MGWNLDWLFRPKRKSADASTEPAESAGETNRAHQYASDQPISTRVDDRLNRAQFASRIADTIATRADPASIVIGVYGPWGDGKTSVLAMMEEAMRRHPHVICARFNPWHFQSAEHLLRGFLSTLAEAMGKSLPTKREKLGDALQKYGDILSLASVTVASIVEISPGAAAKGIGESLSTAKLEDLKSRIEGMLDESGKRVAILIDDIDRLDREETPSISLRRNRSRGSG